MYTCNSMYICIYICIHTPSRESQRTARLKTNHNGTLRIQEVTEVSAKLCKSAWDCVQKSGIHSTESESHNMTRHFIWMSCNNELAWNKTTPLLWGCYDLPRFDMFSLHATATPTIIREHKYKHKHVHIHVIRCMHANSHMHTHKRIYMCRCANANTYAQN